MTVGMICDEDCIPLFFYGTAEIPNPIPMMKSPEEVYLVMLHLGPLLLLKMKMIATTTMEIQVEDWIEVALSMMHIAVVWLLLLLLPMRMQTTLEISLVY